jgi:hypothetical protein
MNSWRPKCAADHGATTPIEVVAQLLQRRNLSSTYWAAVNHSATPPWLEQVPLRCCDFE